MYWSKFALMSLSRVFPSPSTSSLIPSQTHLAVMADFGSSSRLTEDSKNRTTVPNPLLAASYPSTLNHNAAAAAAAAVPT